MCEPPGSRQGGDARGGPCERSSHHRRRAASREARGAMRGTGQPLCSQTRTATCCCSTCAALELWLLLQLNSLHRVPYVRMHFRLSDQASWVVASHKARFGGPGLPRTWSLPRRTARQRTSFAAARFEFLLLFSDARVRLDPRGNDGVATATARRAWILRPGIIVWFPTVSLHQQFTLKIVNRRGEVPERPALALEVDGKTSGATGRSTSARACLGQPLPLCLAACSST